MQDKSRLTVALPLDKALPSWITPNNQDGFLSLDRSEVQDLDFTPSEMIYPFKLKRLRPQVLLEVLPKRLAFRTPYFNSVRELEIIIQRPKPMLYKDSVSKMYISLPVKTGSSSDELARLYPPFKKRWLYTPFS